MKFTDIEPHSGRAQISTVIFYQIEIYAKKANKFYIKERTFAWAYPELSGKWFRWGKLAFHKYLGSSQVYDQSMYDTIVENSKI